MSLSNFRQVSSKGEYALWLSRTAGANGVYIIRKRATRSNKKPVILYVGESHTHRLRETLQRHFQQWKGETAGPTFDAARTEVAIEIFLIGDDAIRKQNQLIRRFRPVHNIVVPEPEADPKPPRRKRPREDEAYDEVMSFFEALAE
jgi:hypothetical protein